MIINFHSIDDNYIIENNIIKISLNNDQENKSIIINNKRKIYKRKVWYNNNWNKMGNRWYASDNNNVKAAPYILFYHYF